MKRGALCFIEPPDGLTPLIQYWSGNTLKMQKLPVQLICFTRKAEASFTFRVLQILNCIFNDEPPDGFEPPTRSLQVSCSGQLS